MLTVSPVPIAICLFIDGLDEFEGRYDTVTATISKLCHQDHVKSCVSSRPLTIFERTFSGNPSLKVQDLTYQSIHDYVNHQLFDPVMQRTLPSQKEQETLRHLLHDLVTRADGVFLWAVIATRELREGLEDSATLQELETTIEGLPSGIENLYSNILNRIKPAYQREAVKFLQTVLYDSECLGVYLPLDILRLYFINQQWSSEDRPLICRTLNSLDVIRHCSALRTRLLSHTMGLLDLTQVKDNKGVDQAPLPSEIFGTKIAFHHRSVKEFLLTSDAAKSFVASTGVTEQEVRLSVARGSICELICRAKMNIGDPEILNSRFDILRESFHHIAFAEEILHTAQSKFMRSLHDYPSLCRVPQGWGEQVGWFPCNFWNGEAEENFFKVDFVALAATLGMLHYVCEIFECQHVSPRHYPDSILDFQQSYSASDLNLPIFSWNQPVDIDLRAYKYWDRLSELLCVKTVAAGGETDIVIMDSRKLTATYLLYFALARPYYNTLFPQKLKLAHTLLHQGADPMVKWPVSDDIPWSCAWKVWLLHLKELCWTSRVWNTEHLESLRISSDDLWNTTRALLANGASIDYKIPIEAANSENSNRRKRLHIKTEVSALFVLHNCFGDKAEFQEFAAATNAPPKRSWRNLLYLRPSPFIGDDLPELVLCDGEREIIWPALEKWEESGQVEDFDGLYEKMRQIWNAKQPDHYYIPDDLEDIHGSLEKHWKSMAEQRANESSQQ